MDYKAKDYTHLLGLKGFSDRLLKNHFELYQGYVKNTNQILSLLTHFLEEGEVSGREYSEIKRRLPFELNGIKLHEYYFGNMIKGSDAELDHTSALYKKLVEEFGSYTNWKKSFKAVGAMRGIGWAMAIYDPRSDLILNTWVEEHHLGHIAGTVPILVMDLWEHAMLLDYGSNRHEYIESFFKVIDWETVSNRFDDSHTFEKIEVK